MKPSRPTRRRIMNPVDWLAWVYGKLFLRHAWVGGAIVVLLFAVIGLVLWLRAVDKYNEEYSPKREAAKVNSLVTEPVAAPALQATPAAPAVNPPKPHEPEAKKPAAPPAVPPKSKDAPSRSASTDDSRGRQPPQIQNCPGGICAGGDINGSPQIISPPPPLAKVRIVPMGDSN